MDAEGMSIADGPLRVTESVIADGRLQPCDLADAIAQAWSSPRSIA